MRRLAIGGLLLLAACATPITGPRTIVADPSVAQPAKVRGDPFETLNRHLFAFGFALDRTLVRPIVGGYRRLLPRPVRHAVHNVLQNVDEPAVIFNDVLQARFTNAARAAARFSSNSIVGIGGIFDPATRMGLPHHDNSFGSTLGRYGVGPGPYFYIPLLGPMALRDAIGASVDNAIGPLPGKKFRGVHVLGAVHTTLFLVDERLEADQELQTLFSTAADPYASMRSVYLQSRQAEIAGPDAVFDVLPELPATPVSTRSEPLVPPPPAASEPAGPAPPALAAPSDELR
jgi:phospholipid-binding lipoprotein MlaA